MARAVDAGATTLGAYDGLCQELGILPVIETSRREASRPRRHASRLALSEEEFCRRVSDDTRVHAAPGKNVRTQPPHTPSKRAGNIAHLSASESGFSLRPGLPDQDRQTDAMRQDASASGCASAKCLAHA